MCRPEREYANVWNDKELYKNSLAQDKFVENNQKYKDAF